MLKPAPEVKTKGVGALVLNDGMASADVTNGTYNSASSEITGG